jgi:hypothetical protein
MMECSEAQQMISAAYDGEQQDARVVERAKEHCRACAECADFVTTLAAIHRLPAPEMPAPALERMLGALRDEYPLEAEQTVAASPEIREAPRPRVPVWASWAAAAAVLLVAAGVITTQGVRYLLQPSDSADTVGEISMMEPSGDRQAEEGIEGDLAASEPAATDDALTAAVGPSYVVFGRDVYRLVTSDGDPPSGAQIGSVTSSLDTGGPAATYAVYGDPPSDTIVVASDDTTFLRFEPVVRTLRGTPYALRSGSIATFGQWPSLPAGIPEPSAPDGSPVFIAAGTDDVGVTVFVRPGTDPSAGFAVAPGTSPTDPAAGNTGWTWWEPRR